VPCIRGLRIPVATVVGIVADGMTAQEILSAFPDLQDEDIREALCFAVAPFASVLFACRATNDAPRP